MAPIYDAIGGLINRLDPGKLVTPKSGDLVLDVGGGTGLISTKYDHIPRLSWTVVDLNYQMLWRGRQKDRRCHFVQGSAYQLPFRSNTFDHAFITDALHHMGQKRRVLTEVCRVLHEDGLLLIEEFDPDTPIGRLTETAEWLGAMGSRFVRPDDLYERVRSAGMQIEQTKRHQYLYYIVASTATRKTS